MTRTNNESGKKDIFDRVMALPALRPLRPVWDARREGLLYLFFGGLVFVLNLLLFWLLTGPPGLPALPVNVFAWVVCVAFAFWTNRTWVFASGASTARDVAREAASFAAGRLGTLVLEELVLWLGIERLLLPDMGVKLFAQVLVIAANYIISKRFVFR